MENSKARRCEACGDTVIGDTHRERCHTVMMHGIRTFFLDKDAKPLMTFGLGGCTALLMVFFRADEDAPYKAVLGHTPIEAQVLEWIRRHSNAYDRIATVIRTPGAYVRATPYWELRPENEALWEGLGARVEGYSMTDRREPFQSALYFRLAPEPQYSDVEGRYLPIRPLASVVRP